MDSSFKGFTAFGLSNLLIDATIAEALHKLFDVDIERIMINREGDWWLKPHENIAIICDIKESEGEFPTYTEFISFPPLPGYLFLNLEIIGEFCELLTCHAIVEDIASSSPYAWVLVRGTSDYKNVKVDPNRLDNEDVFVIQEVIDEDDLTN